MKFIFLLMILSTSVWAGEVTIEKKDQLIRNDLFDKKHKRAEKYKIDEAKRNEDINVQNKRWLSEIDPGCSLYDNREFIYFCSANGRYYKGYNAGGKREYRELSPKEIKKHHRRKD